MIECSIPPPLSDDQLSALIDGATTDDLARHLAGCAFCAGRLSAARRLEATLRARLSRWDCPAPADLAAYTLAQLTPAEAEAAEQHLLTCPACAEEAAAIRSFLAGPAELPPLPPPQPPLRPLIARPALPASTQALRGAGRAPLIVEAGDTTVILEVRAESAGQVALIGQIVAEDQAAWEGALVEARQAGAARAVAVVDADGGFSFALPAGPAATLWITAPAAAPILIEAVATLAGA